MEGNHRQAGDANGEAFTPDDLAALQDDLAALARHLFAGERVDHTLQPTALVNELWLRLLADSTVQIRSRVEFLAWASRAMRHLLVDHARRKGAQKRGGGATHIPLADAPGRPGVDLLELDEALNLLEQRHARSARVVEMRFFGGMTDAEVAERLGVSDRTVRADWTLARAWLFRALGDGAER